MTVTPVISVGHGRSDNDGCGEWDDEVRDKKDLYLEGLIKGGHVFEKSMWPGCDATLEFVEIEEKTEGCVNEGDLEATDELSGSEAGNRLKRKGKKVKKSGSRC